MLSYDSNIYTFNINDQQLHVYRVHTISQVFVTVESVDNILKNVYQNSITNDFVQENSPAEDHIWPQSLCVQCHVKLSPRFQHLENGSIRETTQKLNSVYKQVYSANESATVIMGWVRSVDRVLQTKRVGWNWSDLCRVWELKPKLTY